MRVLGSSVLAIEAIVILLATSLATSNGSVADTSRAWIVGAILMVLLVVTIRLLRRRWGIGMGWIMQGAVLATSLIVGWSMLVVGVIISLLQAVTQIQEQTLTFVPKMLLGFATAIFLAPFMLSHLTTFTHHIADRIVAVGVP